jgi:hypothetical protein
VHLSAYFEPASEKLEADVCAEAEVDKSAAADGGFGAPATAAAAAMIASPGMPREHGTTRNKFQMVT